MNVNQDCHSTSTSLISSTNSWFLNIDSGLLNGILFLDLKKAFDTVNHDLLIKNPLFLFVIKGVALSWFVSYMYLNNRTQTCRINQVISSHRTIQCGIPQGSNLGPLLFSLYINDLPNCPEKSILSMYADDTNLTVSKRTVTDLEKSLNSNLDKVYQWLNTNKLSLTVEKNECMIIGSHKRLTKITNNPRVVIGNETIKRVSTTKILGVINDKKLIWDTEIDNISKKFSRGIGIIKKVKPILTVDSLKYMYQTLIQPHFDYCAMVWGNCNKTLKEILQTLQNRAAREITGDDRLKLYCLSLNGNL